MTPTTPLLSQKSVGRTIASRIVCTCPARANYDDGRPCRLQCSPPQLSTVPCPECSGSARHSISNMHFKKFSTSSWHTEVSRERNDRDFTSQSSKVSSFWLIGTEVHRFPEKAYTHLHSNCRTLARQFISSSSGTRTRTPVPSFSLVLKSAQ